MQETALRNCVKKLRKKCTYKMDLEFEPGKARREKKRKKEDLVICHFPDIP